MSLNLTDTIMGSRPGFDPAVILAHMDQPDAKDRTFLYGLVSWCAAAGIDPAVPAAQFLLETDNGRSVRWNNDLNASGMGIVADSTAQPFFIPDVDASARLFVQCLYSLVTRKRHPTINLWASTQTKRGGEEWFSDVWLPKVQSAAMPDVRTVGDLGLRYTERGDSRATWSWEDGKVPQDTYGKKLRSRLSEFYPNLPDQSPPVQTPSTPPEPIPGEGAPMATVTFGKVPRPAFTNREIPTSQNTAFDYLGQREVRAIFLHRMEGSLWGTDEYFRTMANAAKTRQGGLTDFGTDATTGEALMWCNSSGTKSPWASGPVQNPIKSAAIFVNLYGRNAVNQYAESIETSGWGDDAVSAKWRAWVVAEIAYQADDYGRKLAAKGEKFDYTTYPNIPSEQNREFVMSHGWSYDGKRSTCAGSVIEALIPTINKEVKAILTAAQSSGVTPEPVYAPAHPISKGSQIINDHQFLAPGGKTFQRDTIPSEWGDGNDNPTGPTIKKGTKITEDQISHYVQGTDGNLYLVLTGVPSVADGSRVPADAVIAA